MRAQASLLPMCPASVREWRNLCPSHIRAPPDLSPVCTGALALHSGPSGMRVRCVSANRTASKLPVLCKCASFPLLWPSQSCPIPFMFQKVMQTFGLDPCSSFAVSRGVTHAAPSPIAVIAAEIVSVAVKLKGSCHEYQWQCKALGGEMVALPAAGTVIWGVQALTPTFVTAETMARAGANKINHKNIEECSWHKNAEDSQNIACKIRENSQYYEKSAPCIGTVHPKR